MRRATNWLLTAVGLASAMTILSAARSRVETASPFPADASSEFAHRPLAGVPRRISLQSWKDLLWRTYEEINEDRILAVSGGVVFFVLLAIFPTITAFVSIYGLFASPLHVADDLQPLMLVVPDDAGQFLIGEVQRIASKSTSALGLATGISLLLAAASVIVVPLAFAYLGLGAVSESLWPLLRWPLLVVVGVAGLSLLYRYGPSRTGARWRWLTIGSLVAIFLWLIVSLLFAWYLGNFADYNGTYGSLGAVIGLLTWLWLSVIAVLIGAELDAEVERQAAPT